MFTIRRVAWLSTATLLAIGLMPGGPWPAPLAASAISEICNGLTPTIVGAGAISGTPGDDVILGSAGGDLIDAGDGNDMVCGADGNDTIVDGGGDDVVLAGHGDDHLAQGPAANGADDLRGEDGIDVVNYSARRSTVVVTLSSAAADDGQAGEGDNLQSIENALGGSGDDVLLGTAGDNHLSGGAGADMLNGGAGADQLTGGLGDDFVDGSLGDDRFPMGALDDGDDVILGGPDIDLLDYSQRERSLLVDLAGGRGGEVGEDDALISVERVDGGLAADLIEGGEGDDVLSGGPGGDTIVGRLGADTLNGEGGSDHLISLDLVPGNDIVRGGGGTDAASADPGDHVTGVP